MRAEAALNARLARAATIVMTCIVKRELDGTWLVQSQHDGGRFYRVQDACSCPDAFRAPDRLCKHALAVAIVAHVQGGA